MKIKGSILEISRRNHDSVLRKVVPNLSKPKSPINILTQKIMPNALIHEVKLYDLDFGGFRDFIRKRYVEEYPPAHIRNDLPQKPTDIKGVDQAVYKHINRKQMLKKMPTLWSNKFFTLKFFPELHHISLARKSNIAYTFTNRGGFNLNDPVLEKALGGYKGKYKKYTFFQENLCPLDTAVGRAKYRKFIKRSLFSSLHKYIKEESELELVKGVFFFRFSIAPATDADKLQVMTDLDLAIKMLLNPGLDFKLKVLRTVKDQNKAFRNGEVLVREISFYNTIGAKNVPGYYPKLPYLKDTKKLL